MLAAGQMMGKGRAVGHQLAALLPPGHLHLAAAATVASAVLLLPPGLQHLAERRRRLCGNRECRQVKCGSAA